MLLADNDRYSYPRKRLMAIYTTVTKKEILNIVDEFMLGDLVSFTGVKNGSVNTHYLIETKKGRFFAKIDEVKGELEVKQELDLLLASTQAKLSLSPTAKNKNRPIHD